MHLMGNCYYSGLLGLQQDETKAIELWIRAAGYALLPQGKLEKAKFHLEAAAMAGHEGARNNSGQRQVMFVSGQAF
jgi:TPR repeat protein